MKMTNNKTYIHEMCMDLDVLFKIAESNILKRGLKSPNTRLNGLRHVEEFVRNTCSESCSLFSKQKDVFKKKFELYKGKKINGAENTCVNLLFDIYQASIIEV